ncbi:MAG: 23S rRNA (guanosine(2251)-2'-O)-methyltransferase RlmB [Eubacteriales bacterium]
MYTDPKNKKFFKASPDKAASQEKRSDKRQLQDQRSTARPVQDRSEEPAPAQNDQAERTGSPDRLEGRNPVLEALRAGRAMNKLWVAKLDGGRVDPIVSRIVAMARERNVLIMEVPRITLDQMSETHNHQGVIANVASHDYMELDDIIQRAKDKGEAPLLLLLDELKDAYNLGSILRIADAAGVHGVIIPKHRSIGLDSLVAKASAGAIEYVPVARVTNLSQTISTLKEDGFWVAGTDAEGTIPYNKADLKGPLLIVIGSEGEGMNKNIREKCDFLLSIPMSGNVNSLNAAVAAGIVVFEAQRQRTAVK